MAEGVPLLREYGTKIPIEGSNPSLSAVLRFYCIYAIIYLRAKAIFLNNTSVFWKL